MIVKIAFKTVAGNDQWDEKFRMQGFVDQTPQTFTSLRDWIFGCYNKGPRERSETFPLKERLSSRRKPVSSRRPVTRKSRIRKEKALEH